MSDQLLRSKTFSCIRLPVLKDPSGSHIDKDLQAHTLLDRPQEFGLPSILSNLPENRLESIGQKVSQNRTIASMFNRQMKFHMDVKQASLDKQANYVDARHRRRSVEFKTRLVDLKGYKQCLKMQCEKNSPDFTNGELPIFGMYGGATFVDLKPEVEQLIIDQHPRKKRQRQVNRMLHTGIQDGRLMDMSGVLERVSDIVERPFQKFVWTRAEARRKPNVGPFLGRRDRFALHRQNEEYVKLATSMNRSVSMYGNNIDSENLNLTS